MYHADDTTEQFNRWLNSKDAALTAVVNWITTDAPKLYRHDAPLADTAFVSELSVLIDKHYSDAAIIDWAADVTDGDFLKFDAFVERETEPEEEYEPEMAYD